MSAYLGLFSVILLTYVSNAIKYLVVNYQVRLFHRHLREIDRSLPIVGSSVTRKNRQMSIKFAQDGFTRK